MNWFEKMDRRTDIIINAQDKREKVANNCIAFSVCTCCLAAMYTFGCYLHAYASPKPESTDHMTLITIVTVILWTLFISGFIVWNKKVKKINEVENTELAKLDNEYNKK